MKPRFAFIDFTFQTAKMVFRSSLRANGSRECAPDDRLREAIHLAAQRKNGLLRRFRLRSVSYGGQVAPRNDVESKYGFAISRRDASESCKNRSPLKSEGAGNAGCPMHPQPRV
jgi:hypothetical protein